MTVIRWDPLRELSVMQDRINRVFGDVYTRRGEDDLMTAGTWVPSVDIHENEQHELVIAAELPGVDREKIDLHVEDNTLTIRGERPRRSDVKDDQFHRVERLHGPFSRSFSLPPTANPDQAQAEYRDGVLTVTIPKREEARPRQIRVTVG